MLVCVIIRWRFWISITFTLACMTNVSKTEMYGTIIMILDNNNSRQLEPGVFTCCHGVFTCCHEGRAEHNFGLHRADFVWKWEGGGDRNWIHGEWSRFNVTVSYVTHIRYIYIAWLPKWFCKMIRLNLCLFEFRLGIFGIYLPLSLPLCFPFSSVKEDFHGITMLFSCVLFS